MEMEVSVTDIEPRIWRRFLLRQSATFLDLHDAIQEAGPWDDYHLFEFFTDRKRRTSLAGAEMDDDGPALFDEDATIPARKVRLDSHFTRANTKCLYLYDFGDGWEVEVRYLRQVELPEKFRQRLLDGARAFPPEDCGGVYGYYDCLAALGLHDDPEMKADKEDLLERREWLGDWQPEGFDLTAMKKSFDR
jgi:hypothetical protein